MKESKMKKQNRTAPVNPAQAVQPARPARAEASKLPECLTRLADASTPARRSATDWTAATSRRIEPNPFSRAEMREIVMEMIG
jgi:hypothetical protein